MKDGDFLDIRDARRQIFIFGWKKKNSYKPSLLHRLKPSKKQLAKTICTINVAIPGTAWPITNPIIYKIIINSDKVVRKVRLTFL